MSLKSLSSVERSKNLLLQISSSFLIKGLLFLVTYAQFPVFNKFLNNDEFGLWLTFISFYNWFILLDFGIGHGIKNILTEKISRENNLELKRYASSAFAATLVIALAMIMVYELIKHELIVRNLFITSVSRETLLSAVNFTFYSCIILFLHNTLSAYMLSVQKGSYTNYLNLFVNIAILLLVIYPSIALTKGTGFDPLIYLTQINWFFYLLFMLLISFLFFRTYPDFIPRFRLISWNPLKSIFSTGFQFFLIQISVLFLFPIDSFILANYVSASSAGDFNVLIKIYSIFIVAATTINQSAWPSITEAYYKKDHSWLKKLFKKMIRFNLLLIIIIFILSYFLNPLISLWMQEDYNFALEVIALTAFLHLFFMISTAFSTILYSTNSLKSQLLIGGVIVILKIILIYWLVIKGGQGLQGTLLSSLICFILFTSYNAFLCVKKFRNI